MANTKIGTVDYRHNLGPILSIFRLRPEDENKFPEYKGGQYIALRRDDCRMTKKIIGPDGARGYLPDYDEKGEQKRGPVTHSYSISSAPFETLEKGYLEFYVILEECEPGIFGRLTESLFQIDPVKDNKITYFNKIAGDFTLDKRAAGFENVVLVGTGTGLAPFAAMMKQLHFEASQGKDRSVRYTLFHSNRTYEELGYHKELLAIEAAKKFDFVYVPSVSRPTPRDYDDPTLGKGRASNMLRHVMEMPLKEEEELQKVQTEGGNVGMAKANLERTVRPVLPHHLSPQKLQERLDPSRTVILTCGNPQVMADIKHTADANKIRFEKEDW